MAEELIQIEQDYIKVLFDIYPGLSTLWGKVPVGFTDFSENGIKKALNALKSIRARCMESEYNEYLLRNINTRIFELDVLRLKMVSSYYFYDVTLGTLLLLWDDFVLFEYGITDAVIKEKLMNIIPIMDVAIETMSMMKFSFLDLLCTECAVKRGIKVLGQKGREYPEIAHLFQIVIEQSNRMLKSVNKLKNSVGNKNAINIYGAEYVLQYLNLETGWGLDNDKMENYYEEAIKNVKENTVCDVEEGKKCTVELLEQLIDEIYDELKSHFGEMPNLKENLKIIEINNDKYVDGIFFYGGVMNGTVLEGHLFFASKYRYRSIEQLKLKLVHEIYPGHHYMKTKILSKYQSVNALMLWKNDIVSEGWAKYCEYFYATLKGKLDIFHERLSLMSLMFIIVMDIHYYNKSLKDVIEHAKKISKKDTGYVHLLVVNAFKDWKQHLSYYLGFVSIKEKENISIDEILK